MQIYNKLIFGASIMHRQIPKSIKQKETPRAPATSAAGVQVKSCEVFQRHRFGTPRWNPRALGLNPNFAMTHDLMNCILIDTDELTGKEIPAYTISENTSCIA